ncbi:MAG: hypothetical protein ACI4MH_06875 [Candidatus Coproplasma sp.]
MNYTQPKQITEKTKMPNRGARKLAKNTCMTLIWPVCCLVVALILSAASGKQLFQSMNNFWVFMSTVLTTFVAIWALNTNLNSGRMDFSLGATGILAALLASKTLGGISYNTMSGILSFMSLTVLYGMVIGLASGLVYILTRLPAIVTSLGMCLVFEGIAALVEGKSGQIQYRPSGKLAAQFTSQPSNIIIILVIVIVVMSLIICYSRFGYNKNALVYNQKIAVETGINEILSCIVCYIIAGALIGLYEVLQDLSSTYMTISVDLGSASTVFRNFLPIFIGSMMMRYSNQLISSFFATIATTLLTRGLDNAGALGITSPISSLITSVMILCVLTYMVDKQAFVNWLKMRRYLFKQKRLGLNTKTKKEKQSV